MRVVTERLVEGRQLSDGPIDEIRPFRGLQREEIHLHRCQDVRRRIRISAQNGLAPHDDHFVRGRYASTGPQHVLKLSAIPARNSGRWPNAGVAGERM